MYPKNDNVYDAVENGDSVYDDIAGMSIAEMEDYFLDADPCAFL